MRHRKQYTITCNQRNGTTHCMTTCNQTQNTTRCTSLCNQKKDTTHYTSPCKHNQDKHSAHVKETEHNIIRKYLHVGRDRIQHTSKPVTRQNTQCKCEYPEKGHNRLYKYKYKVTNTDTTPSLSTFNQTLAQHNYMHVDT